MYKPVQPAYLMLVSGLVLFTFGMIIDVAQHGLEFVMSEFRHAPWAHGLPLAGILLILVGTVRLRSSER
ncbi:hypothetical protein [Nitrospira lenta]|jgi:hypothetical protein|uniref:Uncharacterized protein n=1 Tax=Nitrospira lenta TaxID=1436998 RepID=A0A330LB87_9BACT|nr:hypothetical protein [Nitrospira lenta]SPP66354.1 hypothetical protein NITLEN_60157 [Nitrospira lenta]